MQIIIHKQDIKLENGLDFGGKITNRSLHSCGSDCRDGPKGAKFLYKFLYKRIVIVDQTDKRAKNKDIDGCRRPGLLPATTSSKIVNAYTKNISTMSFHVIHGMSRLKKQFKYYRKCSPRFITAQIEENQPEVPHHTTEG